MKPPSSRPGAASPSFRRVHQVALFSALIFRLTTPGAFASSATWKAHPPFRSIYWNEAANWTPETVPNGFGDVATLGRSDQTYIVISVPTEVAKIIFNPGASAYSINFEYTDSLATRGIINNSGKIQEFIDTRQRSQYRECLRYRRWGSDC
jgi:hypothetical protein